MIKKVGEMPSYKEQILKGVVVWYDFSDYNKDNILGNK